MKNRADEIRRRHETRKKQKREFNYRGSRPAGSYESGEAKDRWAVNRPYSDDDQNRGGHPLARKEWMIFRVMIAAVLFLGVGVLFKNPTPAFNDARAFVKEAYQNEFQFAVVSDWYKNQFGEPLALLPQSDNEGSKAGGSKDPGYVMPVNGTVTESFSDNGKGIMLETGNESTVGAVQEGFISFVGKKKGLGKTVVIQHSDGSESWYGKLEKVDVSLYDYVKRGEKVGKVQPSGDGKSGTFYFAMKKGDTFVNPLKVIDFE